MCLTMFAAHTANALSAEACPAVLLAQGGVREGLRQWADGVTAVTARGPSTLGCRGTLGVTGHEAALGAAAEALAGGALRPRHQAAAAPAQRVVRRDTARVRALFCVTTVASFKALHNSLYTTIRLFSVNTSN